MQDCGWRAEVLTPSSMEQAREYANIRRAQSPDGRFSLRYLRNSEYEVAKGWNPSTIWIGKMLAFLATAAAVGIAAAKYFV